MNFKPPLQDVLAPRSVTYLAHAPAEVRDPAEHAEVDALNQAFSRSRRANRTGSRRSESFLDLDSYRAVLFENFSCGNAVGRAPQ